MTQNAIVERNCWGLDLRPRYVRVSSFPDRSPALHDEKRQVKNQHRLWNPGDGAGQSYFVRSETRFWSPVGLCSSHAPGWRN